MNWLAILVGTTGLVAAPVLAGVVAPGLMTDLAGQGFAVHHRHFVFDELVEVERDGTPYLVYLGDADLYELPLTTQVVLRGAVSPAPSDAEVAQALQQGLQKFKLPVLSYEMERSGEQITVVATLPAGVLAGLSPQYQAFLAKYERPG